MRQIVASIELVNAGEILMASRHLIGEEEIKHIRVNMLVDTGAMEMCINENIRDILQLRTGQKKRWLMANDEAIMLDMAGPIEVRFGNCCCTMDAVVLPGDSEPLLGALPMEAMDIMIHPRRQELIVNPEHPDGVIRKLSSIRRYGPTLYFGGEECG